VSSHTFFSMRRTVGALAVCWLVVPLAACHKTGSPATSSPTAPSATAKLAVNQSSYGFPTTTVGQVAQSPPFDLSVTGTGSLTIATITGSNPAEFVLSDVANCVGATLAGATSCKISARFQPVAPGVRSSKIIASSSDGNSSVTLDLFGTAIADASSGSGGGDSGGGGGGSGGGGTGGGSGGGGTGGGGTGGSGSGGGSFAQAPCVPNGGSGIILTAINTTSELVQLTMTGPQKQVFSLASGDIALAPIQPGNYTITGEAPSAPNSSFSPSQWILSPGCDYLLQVVFKSQSQLALASR
jgi:hypothetical protein